MSISRRIAVGLAAAGAIAVTGAPAASAHSPSAKGVSAHAKKAHVAMKRVAVAVDRHNSRSARKHLAVARRQAAVAAREARALRAAADTPAEYTTAAGALGLATDTYTDLLTMISGLIDEVSGIVQSSLAKALPATVNGHTKLLDMLNGVVALLPEQYQDEAAAFIAQLTAATADPLGTLTGLLGAGGLPVDIASIVTTAVQTATEAVQMALSHIEALLPSLPAIAQGPIRMALTMVTDIMDMVTGTLGNFLPGAGAGTGSGAPQAGGLLGGLISGPMSMVQNLLGGVLGGNGGGLFGGLLPGFLGRS
jgi:hypothetical protein